jgi:nitroreductase
MMPTMFMSLIRKRRSIRQFQAAPVEKEKADLLVEAALRSPSSRGSTPWQFVVVTDRGMLERLSRAKAHGSAFLKDAALGIVVCADATKSDVWVEDASIATVMIQLAAESLGLGSCWIQIRERMHDQTQTAQGYMAGLLQLPPGLMVEAMVAIGYPAETKPPRAEADLAYSQVHGGVFGTSFR